jgi:hypothetical protein
MNSPYEDTYLRQQALKLIELQRQGKFLASPRDPESGAPLLPSLQDLCLRRARYPYDYEADWGRFKMDYAAGVLVLTEGRPPEAWLPQPVIQLATAVVHPGHVSLLTEDGSDPGLTLDLRQEESDYRTLRQVNVILSSERQPFMVWKLEWPQAENALEVIAIANDSAMIFASSAIWSPEDSQLVAALVASPSKELLTAIRATLANNNNKSWITLKSASESAYLRGAKRGFVQVSASLAKTNAVGTAVVLLHPLAGNPQEESAEHFYVTATPSESFADKFSQRLALAIPWPTQPTWAEYLLTAGQEAGLVELLPNLGPDFAAAMRICKDEAGWQAIIAQGLQSKAISI